MVQYEPAVHHFWGIEANLYLWHIDLGERHTACSDNPVGEGGRPGAGSWADARRESGLWAEASVRYELVVQLGIELPPHWVKLHKL